MSTIKNERTTAIALGFFDGVHLGHRAVVEETIKTATEHGLKPCVFTFTTGEGAPKAKAGGGLISTEDERKAELLRLGAKEIFCHEFAELRDMTGEEFVRELLYKKLGAAALCCGENFRFGKHAASGITELKELCTQLKMVLKVVPAVLKNGTAVSSTRIRAAIAGGEMQEASRLLGRHYSFCIEVVHGKKLGRTINAPTINQPLPQGLLLPHFGVYASFARVGGTWYPAVTNIGVKPTVTNTNIATAETCIIGLTQNLYGMPIEVAPVQFMRKEIKFADVAELKTAIESDLKNAVTICAGIKDTTNA